ncbi:MAG: carotenoid biosynthesis protein [Actinomycetota bacterium]|nr:carotenoid biosynthesis protein [Actinomycetota bacterium]HZY66692.1 carotenoid biosynthesis protein [Rubrobacteraceae bacterium]
MLTGALRSTPQPLMLASAFFFVAAYSTFRFPDAPGAGALSYLATFAIALPAALALFRYLGPRRAGLSLLALAAFAYTIETIGVATGFPYGAFYYGDSLGPKALGLVPYLLPVSYLPLVIGAVAAAWGPRSRGFQILGAALLLTLMDGVLDPGAAALGFWVWAGGGLYYGVPFSNYLGWLLSGALAAAITLFVGRWKEPPLPALLDSAIVAVAFWTGVSVFALLPVPALLGAGLFVYLLYRRSRLSGVKPVASGANGYKLEDG